ncbi:Zn peptidase [Streptococcus acidominimus]|uniref:Zn peptidase n=2 Tax=Streptococcus acidominimus TaxID=1326 RepID=A0A380ID66_STRAI|nr:Zn peptidase [Streptococcus acidominimus]
MLLYRNLYDETFLEKFKDKREEIENLSTENLSIDVDEIANRCGIKIEYKDLEYSGEAEQGMDSRICVNIWDPKVRQRFTIAHEIGHIILEHQGKIHYRDEDSSRYKDVISRMNEVSANKFAATLLMPRKLVQEVVGKVIEDLGYTREQNFDNGDVDKIIEIGAGIMNVSEQSFRYRLDNLQVFVDA